MARREDAGGFFYSLGIDTDKGSFARAGEAINGLVNTAKAAAIAIGAALTIKGTVKEAMEDLNWANKLGIGTYELDKWQAATAQIGINFNGIAREIDALDKSFRDIQFGDFDAEKAKAMAQLFDYSDEQMAFDQLQNLSPTERFKRIMDAAQKATGRLSDNQIRDLLGKILGGTTGEMFNTLQAQGKTLGGLFSRAEGAVFDTTEQKKALAELNAQFALTKASVEGIWENVVGTMSEKWLNPGMEAINTWISKNKDKIENGIGVAFKVIETTFKTALGFATKIAEHISTIFGVISEAVADVMKLIDKGKELANAGIGKAVEFDEKVRGSDNPLIKKLVEGIDAISLFLSNNGQINDGIISPGGGITKVDSNDWVLAFKNIGDVAGAFNHGGQGGVANVTITQTFNVNGNPMPSQVREQAYRGTSSALGEVFSRAGMIIQMMPGTR